MLRYLCCKYNGCSSSNESVAEILETQYPTGEEEENVTLIRDEQGDGTCRQENVEQLLSETRRVGRLLKKEVHGFLSREEHGDLSCASRSPWEVGRHENVRDESIAEAQGQHANTGVSEAASGSTPKLDSLARETTISTPSVEDRKSKVRIRRESFSSQEDNQGKNRNLVSSKTLLEVDNGSWIYEQTEHEAIPEVLSVTAERNNEPNVLSDGAKKARGCVHYQEERTREVDEGGKCDLPSNNSESPYHLNSHSINTEYHRGKSDHLNSHSVNSEYHRETPDYLNSHIINTEYHRGASSYQNLHSINTEYHRGTPDYLNSHIINTEYHRGTPDYLNSHIINTEYNRGTSGYRNLHSINTEYHRGTPDYLNSHIINNEYHRGTSGYRNSHSINTAYHRGSPDYLNSHMINTEYNRGTSGYRNLHSINTEYHRGTPDYLNSHIINNEYHKGTSGYRNSHSINTEYHRGTPDYRNSHSINTEYHRGSSGYRNSHSINIDTAEYHRGTPGYQTSYSTKSDTTDFPSESENRTLQGGSQRGLHSRFHCENQPTCRNISCLYNQTGYLCTVEGERLVWTLIGLTTVLVRTHVTESGGATVGCRLVWRGRVPVPISELPDYTEVQFDAVILSQMKVFHAIVIWRDVKPHLVIEPPPATCVFINGRGVSVSQFVSLTQTAYVEVNYEGITVNSEVTRDLVFFHGEQASCSQMSMMSSFPPGRVFATVCKMMEGDAVGSVTYTIECVWCGKRPQVDLLPTDFKRGEVYKQEPSGKYIRDHKHPHFYCDVSATLMPRGQSCMLIFCIGKETIRVPVKLERVHFKERRLASLPPSNLPVKAHVVKCWGKCFWKVLMVQLPSLQDSVVDPYDSGVVLGAPNSTVNSPGLSQPQESADFRNIPVRSAADSAQGEGSLTSMIWVEGCVWNVASISQGIATLINKSILIKQDRFYVDGEKVRDSEPLAKFISKDALVNAVIEPQFRPIEVLGKTVTHRAIVAWLGTKPQDIDTFLESDSGEAYAEYDFQDNSRPLKKTFVVERNHDCPTPATDKHDHGMTNGTRNGTSPNEASSDKLVSYAGSCNWKIATISLGIIAHAEKTIVVKPSAFFVDQVRVSGSDPLVRFTFNDTPVNAEVVALSSAHPVLGYTATHEALLAWQGERPLEADSIIADYIAGKPRENPPSGVTVHGTGYKRSVFLKVIEERISSSCTVTDGSADEALIINNVMGKLYKIGIDYGILKLRCGSLKEPNALVLFHPFVAYVDKKRLSSNKPLDQQLNLSNPRLWHCRIQKCIAKIAEVTVHYKAILAWQGKKPSEEEMAQQDSESRLRAADEAEWRDTREDHEKNIANSNKNTKPPDAPSEAAHRTSTPSDEDDVSRVLVRGKLTFLNAKRGRLRTHTRQYINFRRSRCLLYGIRLNNVQLHHVLRTGESVECRLGKDDEGVWHVEVLWVGGELLPLDPCFGYAQLHLWCRDHNVPSEDLATLLHEAGYVEGAAPTTASTTDRDPKSITMTLSTAAVGNESDILHLNEEECMSPDLFPIAGDERAIVEVDAKDWVSPDLFPTAAAGDEKCTVLLDGNDWMSPDLFPIAAAGDERDIVQLGQGC
ncbi:uncharacterized protein [Panulirus ornatus]|uniref:uncharacterized protein n=1 Tax=Panulirus ornatus TaxID=150431 RepID=UPI003A86A294